jgi:hypothetical protein
MRIYSQRFISFERQEYTGDFLERQNVQSCNLRSVGYDTAKKNLEIEFHSGLIYQFQNVPTHIHAGLMNSTSVGSYFTSNIKNRFRSVRLDR